jgi:hypothetical protein
MPNLTKAYRELYRRSPDETFGSIYELTEHCRKQKGESREVWTEPLSLRPEIIKDHLVLPIEGSDGVEMVEWSFAQLCRLAGANRDTVNRVSPSTASAVFTDLLPTTGKPNQVYVEGNSARSIHGASYTRLHNADLLRSIQEFATDFVPPQRGSGGGTGLYCGERDMFCFLIDPTGWVEIEDQAFAPGFFVWNSEVGCRSVGIQTFWFQAICANHIVWDAVEVSEYRRKHTAHVSDALSRIERQIEILVSKRDERRDAFAKKIAACMQKRLDVDERELDRLLRDIGMQKELVRQILSSAGAQGQQTVFSLLDTATRLSQKLEFAGERTSLDRQIAALLSVAA